MPVPADKGKGKGKSTEEPVEQAAEASEDDEDEEEEPVIQTGRRKRNVVNYADVSPSAFPTEWNGRKGRGS